MSPLLRRRKALGLTQSELARLSNVPQPVISMLERDRCYPLPTYMHRLHKALGIDAA